MKLNVANYICFEQSVDDAGFTFSGGTLRQQGKIWHRDREPQVLYFHCIAIKKNGDQIYSSTVAGKVS